MGDAETRRRAMMTMFVAVAAALVATPAARTQTAKKPIPFPAGYDFPANPAALQRMIGARDTAGLRRHGWYLWAGVNQPGQAGWPIWRSWNIATQVFAPAPTARRAAFVQPGLSLARINRKNNPEINLPLPLYLIPDAVRAKHKAALQNVSAAASIPDGDNFQNNGDLMLVSEPYSQPAYDFIRGSKLYLSATLKALLAAGKTDIPQMPAQTIVLKHMYWPVKKDGFTALPIVDMQGYDKPGVPDTTYVGFENRERWARAVAIDPNRAVIPPGETASVTYLYDVLQPLSGVGPRQPMGPHTYQDAAVVPMAQFFYKKLSLAEYNALSVYDRVLIDASFWWVHRRLFEDGDYLVSVASHIITKEIPQWTLQTFWWHDRPDDGAYAKDRPAIAAAKGPWRHYLMTAEYGVPAQAGGGELPIAYNPYIELASHPVVTNCRNCHIRAATPNGQYMQSPGPDALADIKASDDIFKGLLRADFLWTIPDRAN